MVELVRKWLPVVAAAGILLNSYAVASADVLRSPGGGTVHALVIGVNHYSKLGDAAQLRGARADAEDIDATLEKDGVKPVLIVDEQATRARVVDAMDALVKDAQPGDLAFISYAGHGMQTPEYPRWKGLSRNGASEQILLSNFSFSDAEAEDIIVNIEMRAWLWRLNAKGVDTVVVMDASFGGGMRGADGASGGLRMAFVAGTTDAADHKRFTGIPMTDKEARADVAAMPHVTFLAGATANSVVPEMSGLPKDPSRPRGALSYYVARALEGGASINGVVTRKSLFRFVLQNVRQATNGRQTIDIQPGSVDPEVLDKPIFVFGAARVPEPSPSASPLGQQTVSDIPTPHVAPIAPAVQAVAPSQPQATGAKADAYGHRVALVIGNADYKNASLANPTFDADLVAASLEKAGFDVMEVKNADFVAFDAALTRFAAKEEGAEIALFYFAGHGFAIPGDDVRPHNYLMTTSADMTATSDYLLRHDGVTIDDIIKRISAPVKVTLAFVDACRTDPSQRVAGGRGFEPLAVTSPRQVYIGMSTQLGQTAIDGVQGAGSPFAQAFVEQMTSPGLRIDDAFRALRDEVLQKTDGKQLPEILQDTLKQGALVLVRELR